MNFGYLITEYMPAIFIIGSLALFVVGCMNKGNKKGNGKNNNQ